MVKLPSEKINNVFMVSTVVSSLALLAYLFYFLVMLMAGKDNQVKTAEFLPLILFIIWAISMIIYTFDPFGPRIDALMIKKRGQEIVRRKVRGMIVGCTLSDDPEEEGLCQVIVRAGENSEFVFDEIEAAAGFTQVGDEVAIVLDEYRDAEGRPLYRKQIDLEKMKTPS